MKTDTIDNENVIAVKLVGASTLTTPEIFAINT
jgi:hypothetical protein